MKETSPKHSLAPSNLPAPKHIKMPVNEDIDDSLYSRQRYVLGDSAMKQMAHSNVFLSGLGGIGIEIAKNIVLAGIKSLTINDNKSCSLKDLGTQFFLREQDAKSNKTRAEACYSRIAELNPYVSIKLSQQTLADNSDLDFLKQFQCVVLTEATLNLQLKINEFCRAQTPQIKFIMADVYGLYSYCFCDFGDEFTVYDANGEEPRQTFIANITKGNPGVVTCLDQQYHGLETGDYVTFKEVKGMTALNETRHKVKVISAYKFSIEDTSGDEFQPYETGGIAIEVKVPVTVKFLPLRDQLTNPSAILVDFTKDLMVSHLAMYALQQFREENGRLPSARWTEEDEGAFVKIAMRLNDTLADPIPSLSTKQLVSLASCAEGCFAPLCAALGGFVAQEVLKALTGKFTPLKQWVYLDSSEVLKGLENEMAENFRPKKDRYDALRICLGDNLVQKIASQNLFMVGCGAIGCEMLKNFAMLGVGVSGGKITVTDNDIIEKSNLNRQFLFRPHHIQKPKSETAAQSTRDINPDMKIEAHQNKICPQTETTIYTDAFFEGMDVIVNALDNVQARRYVDSRCVTNQKPLMESGTLGAKGHVQVIVPHLTESYGSKQDPPEMSIPYCTLKSFPAQIEHTIQWARDKFESLFAQKPSMYTKYWEVNGPPEDVVKKLEGGEALENTLPVTKYLINRGTSWKDCVRIARIKFEKYFSNKAMQLLHAFPLDAKTSDGGMFWQSPKRPPTPQVFDPNSELHMSFVVSCARLLGAVYNIPVGEMDPRKETIEAILANVPVPPFVPSSKRIVTDESEGKEEKTEGAGATDMTSAAKELKAALKSGKAASALLRLTPAEFEKDDDSNGHIDFITAASNLRANMYSIENADRFKTKLIAGKIVPAIATTTAAVAGLSAIEMVKYIKGTTKIEDYHNCFLNLALPVMMFSEPARTVTTKLKQGLSYTEWDRWTVKGHKDFKLQEFNQHLKDKYELDVSMVAIGARLIYLPVLPGHPKRLKQKMMDLIKPAAGLKYIDLTVGFEEEDEEDEEGVEKGIPPIRYFFGV
ncbi:ubiquitin-like modifier-activating enzyme 6 isoform X1 [Lytechinus pictus]|uniref:ubiquitin-like modifier-activating enzyme 6 isoform X1 n=2 Tax=Lytechinus pictus TaxID=7653 RepID=UPI0030BA065F